MHRCRANGTEQTDRRTDGLTDRTSLNAPVWAGIHCIKRSGTHLAESRPSSEGVESAFKQALTTTVSDVSGAVSVSGPVGSGIMSKEGRLFSGECLVGVLMLRTTQSDTIIQLFMPQGSTFSIKLMFCQLCRLRCMAIFFVKLQNNENE